MLAKTEAGVVVRPLNILIPLIKEDFKAADEAAKEAAIPYHEAAGHKLNEAKAQIEHGKWGEWLDENFHMSERHARYCMSLATARIQNGTPSRTAYEHAKSQEPARQKARVSRDYVEEVDKITGAVSKKLMRDDFLSKEKERALKQDIYIKMIDAGYKVLASVMHPDKGGSQADMTRLNDVRRQAKTWRLS